MAAAHTIVQLEEKLHLLLEKMHFLQQENGRLQEEGKEHKVTITAMRDHIGELEKKLNLLEIASSVGDQDGKSLGNRKELRSLLGEYIREIDRCLAQLNE